ncbi:MAG: hypothetical protein QOG62_2658 [Thermoleophilaceae bacterium]|nr:hypothetical protein [Thermoleophilaceae bacterium]
MTLRRRISIGIAFALAISVPAVLVAAAGPTNRGMVQIAVVFDSASSLIPGNDVLVAGVPVGEVASIGLTEDLHALVVINVEKRFTPFHDDAQCELGTKLLLGEKSVNCDPGNPKAPFLARGTGGLPTVPLEQTSAPVDLDLVLAGARLPYRQRLQIVLNELGALSAARGDDINEVIRRANPALRDARQVFEILDDQKAELKQALTDTDTILASLAKDPGSISGFVRQASNVTRRTAAHADDIGEISQRLPGLLSQAHPALTELDKLTVAATPVARSLRTSAPDLTDLANELGPFADNAEPALRKLRDVAKTGRAAVADTNSSVDALGPAAEHLRSTLGVTVPLLNNLAKRGGPEATMRYAFYVMSSVARFDRFSHLVPVRGSLTRCSFYNKGAPIKNCSGRFDTPGTASVAGQKIQKDKPAGPSGFAEQATADSVARVADKARDNHPVEGRPDPQKRRTLPEQIQKTAHDTVDRVKGVTKRVGDATHKILDFLLGP